MASECDSADRCLAYVLRQVFRWQMNQDESDGVLHVGVEGTGVENRKTRYKASSDAAQQMSARYKKCVALAMMGPDLALPSSELSDGDLVNTAFKYIEHVLKGWFRMEKVNPQAIRLQAERNEYNGFFVLPEGAAQDLTYVVKERNKLCHEVRYESLEDRPRFERAMESSIAKLHFHQNKHALFRLSGSQRGLHVLLAMGDDANIMKVACLGLMVLDSDSRFSMAAASPPLQAELCSHASQPAGLPPNLAASCFPQLFTALTMGLEQHIQSLELTEMLLITLTAILNPGGPHQATRHAQAMASRDLLRSVLSAMRLHEADITVQQLGCLVLKLVYSGHVTQAGCLNDAIPDLRRALPEDAQIILRRTKLTLESAPGAGIRPMGAFVLDTETNEAAKCYLRYVEVINGIMSSP